MSFAERDNKTLGAGIIKQIAEAIERFPMSKTQSGTTKFSVDWLAEELNGPILSRLRTKFRHFSRQEADLVDFVKLILEEIGFADTEAMPLVICAIEFFKRVVETFSLKKAIQFKHVTDFLIDVVRS